MPLVYEICGIFQQHIPVLGRLGRGRGEEILNVEVVVLVTVK